MSCSMSSFDLSVFYRSRTSPIRQRCMGAFIMSKELFAAAIDGFKGSFELLARLIRAVIDTTVSFVNHEESHVVSSKTDKTSKS